MRGLIHIPSIDELEKAYGILQSKAAVAEVDYALYSQWTRFDPRLGEIWIARFARDWRNLRPAILRDALLELPWPSAFGVLIEQTLAYGNLSLPEKKILRSISRAVLASIPTALFEAFFIGLAPFASRSMREDAENPIASYSKWGYFGRDVMINKASQKLSAGEFHRTEIDADRRELILKTLLQEKNRITINDYLEALEWKVSRRVAQKDLKISPVLKARGKTRARFYIRKKIG